MNILLSSTSEFERRVLEAATGAIDHPFYYTENAKPSPDVLLEQNPDIVVLGSSFPEPLSQELLSKLRSIQGEGHIPVLHLVPVSEYGEDSAQKRLSLGFDEVIKTPCAPVEVQAKLSFLLKSAVLSDKLKQSYQTIAFHEQHQTLEQEVARSVFNNIAKQGCLNDELIRYSMSRNSVFNGELILAAYKPTGDVAIMIGDFAGHGIPATICSLPIAESFYSMVGKGFSLAYILGEMNRKLRTILPTGVFCRACAVDIDLQQGVARFWNSGLPESLIYHSNKQLNKVESSYHLPLGVASDDAFQVNMRVEPVSIGDRIYLFSDQLFKLHNKQGHILGVDGIEAIVQSSASDENLFSTIQQSIHDFVGEESDDNILTMVEVIAGKPGGRPAYTPSPQRINKMREWGLCFEVHPRSLMDFDPLPFLLNVMMESPYLIQYKGSLYVILAELYSNALDHGLLGLDSKLKIDMQGFTEYYRQREEALARIESGFIRFDIKNKPTEAGGEIHIVIEDSGPGFDHQVFTSPDRAINTQIYCGRGILLVKSLCETVTYNESGNRVEAVFVWNHSALN